MSGKSKSVSEIKDLFLQEQILEGMPVDLVTYIKDRSPADADELMELVTRYEEARRGNRGRPHNGHQSHPSKTPKDGKEDKETSGKSSGQQAQTVKRECFHCKEEGHVRRNCPKLKREEANAALQCEEHREEATYDRLCNTCEKKKFTKFMGFQ